LFATGIYRRAFFPEAKLLLVVRDVIGAPLADATRGMAEL
jgi:hypothetical protein